MTEWNEHVESILRGVAHALNNRAAALSAAIELARDAPADDESAASGILSPELERLKQMADAVASVGTPRRVKEAFAPSDAAAEAERVLRMHATTRDAGPMEVRSISPVRVERWMFVRALIALAAGAHDVRIVDDGDWVCVRAMGTSAESVLVGELARLMEGEPVSDASGRGFRIPSLASLRRREARSA
jgi:hypothetical protein